MAKNCADADKMYISKFVYSAWDVAWKYESTRQMISLWTSGQMTPVEHKIAGMLYKLDDPTFDGVANRVRNMYSKEYSDFMNDYADFLQEGWFDSVVDLMLKWEKEFVEKLSSWVSTAEAWTIGKLLDSIAYSYARPFHEMKAAHKWYWKWRFTTVWGTEIVWEWNSAYEVFSKMPDVATPVQVYGVQWAALMDSVIDNLPNTIDRTYNVHNDLMSWRFLRVFSVANPEFDKVVVNKTTFNDLFKTNFSNSEYETLLYWFRKPTQMSIVKWVFQEAATTWALSKAKNAYKTASFYLGKMTKFTSYVLWAVNWLLLWVNAMLTYTSEVLSIKKIFGDVSWAQVRELMEEFGLLWKTDMVDFQTMDNLSAHDPFANMYSKVYNSLANNLRKLWVTADPTEIERYVRSMTNWLHNLSDLWFDNILKYKSVSRAILDQRWSYDNFRMFYDNLDDTSKKAVRAGMHRKVGSYYESLRWFAQLQWANEYNEWFRKYMSVEWFLSSWWTNKVRALYKWTILNTVNLYSDLYRKWFDRSYISKRISEFITADEDWMWMMFLLLNNWFWSNKLWRTTDPDRSEREPKTMAGKIKDFIERMSYMSTYFQGIWSASITRLMLSILDWYEAWWVSTSATKFCEQLFRDFGRQFKILNPMASGVWALMNGESVPDAVMWEMSNLATGMLRYMGMNVEKYYQLDYVPYKPTTSSILFMSDNPYQRLFYDISSKSTFMKIKEASVTWDWAKKWFDLFLSNVSLYRAWNNLVNFKKSKEASIEVMDKLQSLESDPVVASMLLNSAYGKWKESIAMMIPDIEKRMDFVQYFNNQLVWYAWQWQDSLLDLTGKGTQEKINDWIGAIIRSTLWEDGYNKLNSAFMNERSSWMSMFYEVVAAIQSSKMLEDLPEEERFAWASTIMVSYLAKNDYAKSKSALDKSLWSWKSPSNSDILNLKEYINQKYGGIMMSVSRPFTYDIYKHYVANNYPEFESWLQVPDSWEIDTTGKIYFKSWLENAAFKYLMTVDRFSKWDITAYQLMQSVSLPYDISPEDKMVLALYASEEYSKFAPLEDKTSFNTAIMLWLKNEIKEIFDNKEFVKNYPELVGSLTNALYSNRQDITEFTEYVASEQRYKSANGWSASWKSLKFASSKALFDEFNDFVDTNSKVLFPLKKLRNGESMTWGSTTNNRKRFNSKWERDRLTGYANSWVWKWESPRIIWGGGSWGKDVDRVSSAKLRGGTTKQSKFPASSGWRKKTKKDKSGIGIKSRYSS